MKSQIDINADLGEGCGNDNALMPFISSASIACGLHAGSPHEMQRTVRACLRHGVAIGAHPSFDDRANFGRRELSIAAEDLRSLIRHQLVTLQSIAHAAGGRLRHVKPHGGLYNLSAREPDIAALVAEEVQRFDSSLSLYGLAGSVSISTARALNLHAVEEVFAERRYEADGRLTPRGHPAAVIDGIEAAMQQVKTMLQHGHVIARDGSRLTVSADTICLHGDRRDVLDMARALRGTLQEQGVAIAAPVRSEA